jgi:UDP-glucose 4-epimerase
MKVLLTGGAGYIGSHVLLRCIEAGHQVQVLDSLERGAAEAVRRVGALAGQTVPVHVGDVRDAGFLDRVLAGAGFDAVLHFAGLKSVAESVADPLRYYDYNVGGTVTLCAAMQRHGVGRLVFSSTAAVYGEQDVMPVTEDLDLSAPVSPYGWTKLTVERLLEQQCAAHPGWSVAILRYFNPVGAHPSGRIGESQTGAPTNLIPFVAQVGAGLRAELSVYGDDYPTPDGTGVRDYIHVLDLADGHLAALDHLGRASGCRVWNLGSGQGISVLQIIHTFERVTGVPLPYRIVPRRPGDPARYWADPMRAQAELGWTCRLTLDRMLEDHWRWQQMNPRGYDG